MARAVSVHLHRGIVRARGVKISGLVAVIIIAPYSVVACILAALRRVVMLEATTNGTGEGVREYRVFRLV